ncbi:UDP-GalNAc:beta-1,3-N-acetylgalactosaminyltransferase 1-like [Biomphalaria glabrata]|uniref:Hexosyltransferase n=1 Tax=Biomphalaria glabrata TaxID=6526 RepID=A0A9W2YW99_BIOGL|nr:UDP-GalNAc:beta-1,3-N-acetylgalactosaminyltransferase 1-like [Biomphalaria glabrata]
MFLGYSKLQCILYIIVCSALLVNVFVFFSTPGCANVINVLKKSLSDNMEKSRLYHLTQRLETQVKAQKQVIAFLSQPIINNFDFNYTRSLKDACTKDAPELLVVVPSAPGNFRRRRKVRRSPRGLYAMNASNKAKLLFFVGRTPASPNVQRRLNLEADDHGDIVMMDFDDEYKNILIKAVSMLRWTLTYCPNVTYVIRTDDDVEVDIANLLKIMRNKSRNYENFILGDTNVYLDVVRDNRDKYYVSREEYPHSTFPPFALGGLLGYPVSSVALLYQAALRLNPIWLDDVFITGMCAPKVDVPLLDDPEFIFEHPGM